MKVLRSHSVYGFDCSSLEFNQLRPNYAGSIFLQGRHLQALRVVLPIAI